VKDEKVTFRLRGGKRKWGRKRNPFEGFSTKEEKEVDPRGVSYTITEGEKKEGGKRREGVAFEVILPLFPH